MAEFCECGSLLIGGRCSNKSCSLRAAEKLGAAARSKVRVKAAAKGPVTTSPSAKASNPRRASKVITYNLYDMKDKEPES